MARLGARAHGVVTRRELLAAGVTQGEIRQRLRTGALLTEHPGVYRVGHRAPSVEARYVAAVRAAGDLALLCGLAAAHLFALLMGSAPPPEVLCPHQRRIRGVVIRRTRKIDHADRTEWKGIPVTTVPRTLVDLAAVLGPAALARACHEAGVHFGTTPARVESVLARRPNARGAGKLRAIMSGEARVTVSALERRFLEVLRDASLPLPETNRPASGRRVDCRWPEHQLTVELDSYRYHSSRHAWERDRRREREAYARGDQFRRYTYDDVFGDLGPMLTELHALIGDSEGRAA